MLCIGAFVFGSVSLYSATNADLSITQVPSASIVNQSTAMTYTLVVTNNDGQTSPDANVSDTLPTGMTYNGSSITSTSATTALWTCTATGTPVVVKCSTTSLWKNSSSTITLNVTSPSSNTSGTVTFNNTATVTSTVADPVSTNNSASSTVRLNRPPVAVDDTISTASHTAVSGNVLTNDSDLDGNATISVVNPGTFTLSFGALTINANGSYTYTPGYFTGETDHYVYTIVDSNGVTASATLQINISSACTDTGNNNTDRTFCLRKQTVLFGDMVTIGNTVVVPPNPQPASNTNKLTYCSTYTTGSFSSDTNNIDNQGLYLCSYRPDIYLNATSAQLITTGKIKWAGLYLQGVVKSTDAASLSSMAVKIKKDAGSYVDAGAPTVINHKSYVTTNSTNYDNYSAFIDVTQVITSQNWQGGVYTVANVPVTTDALVGDAQVIGKYGAWSLVVIYEDAALPLKSVSVYDGWKKITGTDTSSSATVNVGNFYTPSSGIIDSTVSIFVGEGDKYRHGDHLYGWVPGGAIGGKYLGIQDNAFDSGIVSTGTRTPSLSNNQGIDIKTYQIGNGATQLLSSSDNNISFKFSTDGDIDYHYPSMLAFSTEVYHPRMCYYEQLYSSNGLLSSGAQVAKGSPIRAHVLLKNDMAETAQKVMLYRTFDSTMPYTANSTRDNNSSSPYPTLASTASTVMSDSLDTDRFDYSPPLNLFSLHTGTGATYNQGGNFVTNQTELFDYNTTANFDGNTSIVYQIAYTMPTIGYSYQGELVKCEDFNNTFGVIPSAPVSATGDFNVVYATNANATLSSGYYYNLPTAIASRADNYNVIALNSGTDTLKDINTTVAVELVDASSGSCSTYTPLSGVKTWIPFKNARVASFSAADIISGVVLADPQAAVKFYQNAGKNLKFRISYPNDGSGGTIVMQESSPGSGLYHLANFPSYAGNTCYAPVTATKYQGNSAVTTTYTQVPQACGNAGQTGASAMTQHEVDICLECIYGANVNYTCSKDNFAVRPEAFYVKAYDQNQTNPATKLALANNISGAVSLNLASGYNYYVEANATNNLGNSAVSGYTTTEGLDSIWAPTTALPNCNDDSNKTAVLNFANGLAGANLIVSQVGRYALNITDDQWASVDSNVSTMTHHTSPFFLSGPDCTVNSAVTSALGTYNGCNISTNHVNSDAGITYVDIGTTFRPYDFNLTSVQMSKGQSFAGTIKGQNTWVYMNNVNLDANMSVRYFGQIRAEGKDGTLLSNYVNNCYAQPVNLDLNLTFPTTAGLPNWRYRLQEVNATTVWNDTNAVIGFPATNVSFPVLTIPQSSFLKNQNGLVDMSLSLNFDRNETQMVNPITVGLKNFQILCQTAANCSSAAELTVNHLPDSNMTTDNNTTFVYGRVNPLNTTVYGTALPSAQSYMEIYSTSPIMLNNTALSASKMGSNWWINSVHTVSDGNATVTVTDPAGHVPANTIYSNGVTTYSNFAGTLTPPTEFESHIKTNAWLWYGTNALIYQDPVIGDIHANCLHHPCFTVKIRPEMSNWVGGGSDKGNKTQGTTTNPNTGIMGEDMLLPRIRQ